MIVPGSASPLLASAGGYNLTKSLRFRQSANAYLNRTFATGNRRTFTWSGWLKRGSLTGNQAIMSPYTNGTGSGTYGVFRFVDGSIEFLDYTNGTYNAYFYTSSSQYTFRDPSAWYHIVLAVDTTQATGSDRIKIYVNGTQITGTFYATPTPNYDLQWNNNLVNYIGYTPTASQYFDGYLTEVNFIDGQALTPSSFGQTSATTGVWIPKKFSGTYGTNGFYLPFTDNSGATSTTIGKDFSGNGNNWTPNNISVTPGSTYDSMTDVPTLTSATTANYGTLNPLYKGSLQTISNANLTSSKSSGTNISDVWGNFGMTSGKWYFECTVTALASTVYIGIGQGGGTGEPTDDLAVSPASYYYGSADGQKFYGNSGSAYGNTYGVGNVIGCAIDMDSGKIWWSKDGTWQASGDPAAGTNAAFTDLLTRGSNAFLAFSSTNGASNSNTLDWNFGQRTFSATPPTGFKALNTFNLPTPTIGATASTQANDYFNVVTWTGNGTSSGRSITGVGFQPDFVWGKARTVGYGHGLYDAVRGSGKLLVSNNPNSEATNFLYGYLSSFDSDGFTTTPGSSSNENWNQTNDTYVAWNWKANGAGVSNTAGDIASVVSANTAAGFSIVTWTGTGSNRPRIGHGLGVAPSMIIEKGRDAGTGPYAWTVQHKSLSSWNNSLFLNNDSFENSGSGGGTAPTDTVYYAAANNYAGESGVRYVAYCFAPVAGYSAFGSYTGNGADDGVFVFTGFRPRYIVIKRASSGITAGWITYDTARSTYNVNGNVLEAQDPGTEGLNVSTRYIDILSNGFKLRTSASALNGGSGVYVYMAFAESPFKYANAR